MGELGMEEQEKKTEEMKEIVAGGFFNAGASAFVLEEMKEMGRRKWWSSEWTEEMKRSPKMVELGMDRGGRDRRKWWSSEWKGEMKEMVEGSSMRGGYAYRWHGFLSKPVPLL